MSDWESWDGLSYAEITVMSASWLWPALVTLEPDIGSSFLAEDARRLGVLLIEAAAEADRKNEKEFGRAAVSE